MPDVTASVDPAPLAGRRMLVVEDEALIASKIRRVLAQAGAMVVGPVATLVGALEALASDGRIECVLVDIDLRGQLAFPLCGQLAEHGRRFLVVTGYEQENFPAPWSQSRVLHKPFVSQELVDATLAMLASPPPTAAGMWEAPMIMGNRKQAELIRSSRNVIMKSRLLIEEARALRALHAKEG